MLKNKRKTIFFLKIKKKSKMFFFNETVCTQNALFLNGKISIFIRCSSFFSTFRSFSLFYSAIIIYNFMFFFTFTNLFECSDYFSFFVPFNFLSFQTSTAFSIEIFLSSRTLISIIRLAASDGVGIVAVVAVVVVCNSCIGADNSLRVDDDDE